MKGMSKGMMCDSCESCGMHACSKCSPVVLIFGILFLIAGLNLWNPGAWFNGWTILGAFFAIWGLVAWMGKKM